MTNTELHRLLDRAAPEPPDGSGPRAFDDGRSFHPWLVPIAAAVAVLLVAALAVVVTHATRRDTPPAAAPAGQKVVVFHGLALDVPDSFVVVPYVCGAPLRDAVVVFDGDSPRCAVTPPTPGPDVITVSFRPESPGRSGPLREEHQIEIDGEPARLEIPLGGQHPIMTLVDLTRRAAATVSAPTLAVARAILDTAHHTTADARGCPVNLVGLDTNSNASASAILTAIPTSAVSCVYDGENLLVGSGDLSDQQLHDLSSAIASGILIPGANRVSYAVQTTRYITHLKDGSIRIVDARTHDIELASDGQRTVTIPNGGLPVVFE